MSILFQCTECRRLESATRARVSAENVWLNCPSCGANSALVREDAAPSESQRSEPEVNLEPEVKPTSVALVPKLDELEDSPIGAPFRDLISRWDDEEAHNTIVELAAQTDQLAALGHRYRAVLDDRPDDPQAKRAQQRILAAAMATMAPAQKTSTSSSARLLGMAVIGAVMVAGLLFFWTRYMNPAQG